MKFRFILVVIGVLLMGGCTISSLADITPPPDFITPTTGPDLEIHQPGDPPSALRGGSLYTEYCEPCHGGNGLGNGPLSYEMPVAVSAIGMREILSPVSPEEWYKAITLGNPKRGMPSFSHFAPQDRWDIIVYLQIINLSQEELMDGEIVYYTHCTECHGENGEKIIEIDFSQYTTFFKYSNQDLFNSISNGIGTMRTFSGILTEKETWDVIAQLRMMAVSENLPPPSTTEMATPEEPGPELPESDQVITTSTIRTTLNPEQGLLLITGDVINGSGTRLTDAVIVSLVVYDPDNEEVIFTETTQINELDRFSFNQQAIGSGLAYWISVEYQKVTYYSEYLLSDGSLGTIELPVVVYNSSFDWSGLQFDEIQIVLDSEDGYLSIEELYRIRNPGMDTVIIETDGSALPFIPKIEGISTLPTLSPDTGGLSFLPAKGGIAIAPSSTERYGIIAFYSTTYNRGWKFLQEFPMTVGSISLFVPEGMRIRTNLLEEKGDQIISGETYQLLETNTSFSKELAFTISGLPTETNNGKMNPGNWVIPITGGLGVVLISLGIYLYIKQRSPKIEEILTDAVSINGISDDTLTPLLDAVIDLDDEHENGEVSIEIYQKRRQALINKIKSTKH